MARKLERLSSTLGSALRACGLRDRLTEYRIISQWEETVGTAIARHARPKVLRGRKLFLTVDSPAWMQQLSLMKPVIIEKLGGSLGQDLVREIALNLGEIGVPEDHRPEIRTRVPLDAAEGERIDRIVEGIADPEIRTALRRLIEKDFQSKKSGR